MGLRLRYTRCGTHCNSLQLSARTAADVAGVAAETDTGLRLQHMQLTSAFMRQQVLQVMQVLQRRWKWACV